MFDSDAWQSVLQEIESAWPGARYRDVGVVVGCSGGADSVCLVHALNQLRQCQPPGKISLESTRVAASVDQVEANPKGFLMIAHFNHGLRGAESDGDEQFVRELASGLNLPLEVGRSDGSRADEQSARDDRRAFLGNVARASGSRYIALGHSIDDNVETVLYRLLRGTGPQGMTGMSPFRTLSEQDTDRDFVVSRPMLGLRRTQIRLAMQDAGFAWREDRSNESSIYRRNWIRNQLIPLIENQMPHAVPAISRAIDGQQQWAAVIGSLVTRWMDRYLIASQPLTIATHSDVASGANGSSGAVANQHPEDAQAVAIEALRRCWMEKQWPLQAMGQSQWAMLFDQIIGRGPDVIMLPGGIRASRSDGKILFQRKVDG